jgi:transport and Golgi organization protein 2
MCTVTVVPREGGVRVLSNRDELRTRPLALPPRIHHLGQRRAAFPMDPQGGGTWIGVNDAGVVVALLNANPTTRPSGNDATRSRGHIVLDLLQCESLRHAIAGAENLDPRPFGPFRVVIVHRDRVAVAASCRTAPIRCSEGPLVGPLLFTSSSLGDALVTGPRQRLFERIVIRSRAGWLAGQRRFHQHRWPRRPEISVRMERRDALTVSRTTIDITHRERRVSYEAPLDAEFDRVRACCSLH